MNEFMLTPVKSNSERFVKEEKREKDNNNLCTCHQVEKDNKSCKAQIRLLIACILSLSFMIVEIIGGVFSNSLALIADAAHLLSDFSSFLISLFSIWLATRPSSKRMSFGWHRAEVVGAVISVLIIWLITGILVYEAILRIITNEEEVNADVMLITACVGVYVNVFMCLVLHQHDHHKANHHRTSACCGLCARKKQEDHTLQLDDIGKEKSTDTRHISVYAAYLHVISDLVQGIGVVITAYIIKFFPQWNVIDPICTFFFSILVIISTLPVIRDAIPVLMESTTNTHDNDSSITGVPRNIDLTQVENELQNLPDVIHTHSIHIWSLTVNKPVLQAHLAIRNDADSQMVLEEATQIMKDKYGFIHTNLQIEHYQQKMKECHICQRNSSEK